MQPPNRVKGLRLIDFTFSPRPAHEELRRELVASCSCVPISATDRHRPLMRALRQKRVRHLAVLLRVGRRRCLEISRRPGDGFECTMIWYHRRANLRLLRSCPKPGTRAGCQHLTRPLWVDSEAPRRPVALPSQLVDCGTAGDRAPWV